MSSLHKTLWLNGESAESLALLDRAIQYGDGFFTTVLIADKKVMNWPEHWQRIQSSCQQMKMPLPSKVELELWMQNALNTYFSEQSSTHCILKILLTRGEGGIGYSMPKSAKVNTVFYIKAHAVNKNAPALKVGVCETQSSMHSLAGLKTLNRLENVMARTEMTENGFDEGVMLDALFRVVCGTQSNIYLIKDNEIITPIIDKSGVAGTCRAALNNLLLQHGWKVTIKKLVLSDLYKADELFFTNAVRGVQPVSDFHEQYYPQDSGKKIAELWQDWQQKTAIDIDDLTAL